MVLATTLSVASLAALVPSWLVSQRQGPAAAVTQRPPTRVAASRIQMLDLLNRAPAGADDAAPSQSSSFDAARNAEVLAKYTKRVEAINSLEDDIEALDDDQLAAKTGEFRERLAAGASLDELLPEAFAVVREGAWRALELRHYDVQLVGAMALHDGMLAQMATGEGKTLVATCAVYLNAIGGKGAFVVTVNDYLARRDSETMGQVYTFLGLTVGLIQAGDTPEERRAAYNADVTYVTNSELGFDYLRDNLATSGAEVVLPPQLNYCVVDEGDSVLIDEARVPLIISGKTDNAKATQHGQAAQLAAVLEPKVHYDVYEKEQTIALTDLGVRDAEKALGVDDLYSPTQPWAAFVVNGIKAKELFIKDKSYLVREGEAMIIDEFSGRVMEGRRWGDGLHQAIEAKEGLNVQPETEVVASVTYQSLFRRFDKLASMSGTALAEADEFASIYRLQVLEVPPVLPPQRFDVPDSVYKTTRGKSKAALAELLSMHRRGRPVLVGTTSVQATEAFADKLTDLGIEHEVLNASPESARREAEIVAQAGRAGKVTIATNMAGRGTDILLGGNPGFMARLYLRSKLGAALAVEPPKAGFYPCELDEETDALVDAAAAAYAQEAALANVREEGVTEEDARAEALEVLDEMLGTASSAAPIYEGTALDAMRSAFEGIEEAFDAALAEEKEEVMKAGGLHVIGTNLHDSRRIDGQLRGRAGRQGDPGSTHFFLSLEDRIFRLFGGDKVKGLLDFLRISEDQALESDSVAKAVEDTQLKVERYYYELRQKLFEFDEVIAAQREQLYAQRAKILVADTDAMRKQWIDISRGTAADIVSANWPAQLKGSAAPSGEQAAKLLEKLRQFFPEMGLEVAELQSARAQVEERVAQSVADAYDAKTASLEKARPGLALEVQRYLALVQLDLAWKEHMKAMNFVKDFAGLKAYAQMNPLQVYQEEGLKLFDGLQVRFRQNSAYSYFQYEVKKTAA